MAEIASWPKPNSPACFSSLPFLFLPLLMLLILLSGPRSLFLCQDPPRVVVLHRPGKQGDNPCRAAIRQRLIVAQSRQKSYADPRRQDVRFQVGDHVFLRVLPWKGVIRFGKKGKLSPRFIGPFQILEEVGTVAYKVALPPSLSRVHNTFHISMLRKYVPGSKHVLDFTPLEISEDLTYEEKPVEILDSRVKVLRNKAVRLMKILWRNHDVEEATWEREEEMREKYPDLFD